MNGPPAEVKETKRFHNCLKKLRKKYPNLEKDIEIAKKVLSTVPRKGYLYRSDEDVEVRQLRVHCRSKGKGKRSGLRLVYAFREFPKPQILLFDLHEHGAQHEEWRPHHYRKVGEEAKKMFSSSQSSHDSE